MSMVKSLPGFISTALSNRASAAPNSAWKSKKKVFVQFLGTNGTTITNGAGYDKEYNIPKPGVTGVDVKMKGSLGSLREVTVNYKCWSKSQLADMAKAYMQLGRTAAVTFGWTITDDGSKVSGLPSFNGAKMKVVTSTAQSSAKSNNGCVAGYKGVVDNFTFSLDADGGFSCMCHFVTPGEAALDMDMDLDRPSTNGCASMAEDKTEKNSNAIQAGKNAMTATLKGPSGTNLKTGYITIEREQTEEEKSNRGFLQSARGFFGESMFQMDTVYVSWKWIEENMLEGYMFPHKGGTPIYTIDSSDAKISNGKQVYCSDPLVGYIHGKSAIHTAKSKGELKTGDIWNKSRKTVDSVQDLWFNCNWLIEKIKQSEKLEDFIQNVLQGMNNASGNVWELVVVVDGDDPSKLKIVDAGNATGTATATELNMYGPNSVATNVTLDTQVPNGIKASILYGANSKSGKGGNKESGEFRFQPGTDEITPEYNGADVEQPDPPCPADAPETSDSPKEVFTEAIEDLFSGVEQTTVDKVRSAYYNLPDVKKAIEEEQKGDDVLIPINMSFDLEGIEGIPYGAMIQGNYIPGVYKSYGAFMVTGVSHKVDATSWTTSIETIFRRK